MKDETVQKRKGSVKGKDTTSDLSVHSRLGSNQTKQETVRQVRCSVLKQDMELIDKRCIGYVFKLPTLKTGTKRQPGMKFETNRKGPVRRGWPLSIRKEGDSGERFDVINPSFHNRL